MGLLFLLPALAAAQSAPADDGSLAWECARNWSGDRISVNVVRYLTAKGRLAEMYAEWNVVGSSDLVLNGFVGSDEGAEVSAGGNWHAHIGWMPQVYDPWHFLPQIVLGAPEENLPPANVGHPDRRGASLDVKWSELRSYSRRGTLQARIVDDNGKVYRAGVVELARVRTAVDQATKAIALTRADARDYRTRCKPFEVPGITVN